MTIKKYSFTRVGNFKMTGELTMEEGEDIDNGENWKSFLPLDLQFDNEDWEFEEIDE